MQRPCLLPAEHRAISLSSLHNSRNSHRMPPLSRDPAVDLMIDLQRDMVATVTEEAELEAALDGMFRLGVRLSLVVREEAVVGVLSLRGAQRSQTLIVGPAGTADGIRVSDAMIPWSQLSSIDWRTLQQCRIADLTELFTSSSAPYLLVLEQNSSRCERIRGLIDLERLERTARTSSRDTALS